MPGLQASPAKAPPPNVHNVVLGNKAIKPWYPSFYPKEQVHTDTVERLYVCQWCFKYTTVIIDYCAHCRVCVLGNDDHEPLGELIYDSNVAIYEVDGEDHKLFAQNLSLFAKLFLDTKSVFFDVSSFLYYTLVLDRQVIGFFSKEKMSWDNNNVACILVFPPWQKRGYGQVLMGVSYELGRRDGRFGGPERPLSAPGQRAYMTFWCGEVSRYILSNKKTVTIEQISQATWIMSDDIVTALKEMDVYEKRKTAGGSVVISKSKVKTWIEKHGIKVKPPINVDAFVERYVEEEEEEEEDD